MRTLLVRAWFIFVLQKTQKGGLSKIDIDFSLTGKKPRGRQAGSKGTQAPGLPNNPEGMAFFFMVAAWPRFLIVLQPLSVGCRLQESRGKVRAKGILTEGKFQLRLPLPLAAREAGKYSLYFS